MSCKCSLVFDRLLHVYEQVGRKETFVGGKQRYVISDDCTIKPASTSSMQSMPQAFNSDGTGHTFEVVEQLVEWEQVRRSVVARAEPHGGYTGLRPSLPKVQISFTRVYDGPPIHPSGESHD
jgi:hypothetical protein